MASSAHYNPSVPIFHQAIRAELSLGFFPCAILKLQPAKDILT